MIGQIKEKMKDLSSQRMNSHQFIYITGQPLMDKDVAFVTTLYACTSAAKDKHLRFDEIHRIDSKDSVPRSLVGKQLLVWVDNTCSLTNIFESAEDFANWIDNFKDIPQ
jgi:hypothetical protein